ncbi:unnamed protein product [Prunus armeniaca]
MMKEVFAFLSQDLIIAGIGVYEAKQLIAKSGIYELVDFRQWEVVFSYFAICPFLALPPEQRWLDTSSSKPLQ